MRSNMQSHFRSQYFVAKKSLTISSPDKNSKSPSVPASSPPGLPAVFYVLFLLTQSRNVAWWVNMARASPFVFVHIWVK